MVSACALGYSYYAVTEGINEVLSTNKRMLAIIAIGSISTFFISWSLSGLILKIVKSNKKFYYKGLNSFTVRQISSKINTTVFSMTVICLMLFITICVLSSALSMKNSLNRSFESYAPRDVELSKRCDIDEDLKDYGSQGQQRVAILAFKLAEINIFKEIKKTYPIVLLDDIFSELDIEKRNNLLKFIKSNIQFIITTTDIKNISDKIVEKANIFKIKDGNITNYGRKKNYGTTKTL